MQLAQRIHGLAVDCFFFADALFAVTGDEKEKPKVLLKFSQREVADRAFVEVMQLKVPKVTQQDIAWFFVGFQPGKIVFGLLESFGQVFAPTLVLYEQRALPEQIYVAIFAVNLLDAFFEGGDLAALDAEDLEEFVPKALGIGVFAFDVLPVV